MTTEEQARIIAMGYVEGDQIDMLVADIMKLLENQE